MAPSLLDEDVKLASPAGIGLLFVFGTFCYIAYFLAYALYNVYLHPLRKFPGPKSWIAFPVLSHIAAARGLLDGRIREFHVQYGEVVRYTSLEVSFIIADAWKDIYGHGHTLQKWSFPKLPGKAGKKQEMDKSIIAANDADHARYRKSLSHAFSEKALRDQEPLLKVYIDLLIEKLKDVAESREKTDMMKWYNLTTFDMIGDLAFGDSFDGLKNAKYHDWVGLNFKSVKILPFIIISADYPIIMRLAMALMPESLTKARGENNKYARDTVMKRVNNENQHGRGDFMDSMLKHRGEKDGLTDNELVLNGRVLILAGSETTATLLSSVTYWLLRTPETLRKVMDEVRSAFKSEDEINFNNATMRLPYMLACLEEGLRRYPPVPSGLLRWTPPGGPTEIAGRLVPENVSVLCLIRSLYCTYAPRPTIPPPPLDDSLSPHVGRILVTPELPRPRCFPPRTLASGIEHQPILTILQRQSCRAATLQHRAAELYWPQSSLQ
jgi:cytochrome P450